MIIHRQKCSTCTYVCTMMYVGSCQDMFMRGSHIFLLIFVILIFVYIHFQRFIYRGKRGFVEAVLDIFSFTDAVNIQLYSLLCRLCAFLVGNQTKRKCSHTTLKQKKLDQLVRRQLAPLGWFYPNRKSITVLKLLVGRIISELCVGLV